MKSWRKQRPGWPGTESAVCEGGRSSGQGVPARALADQLSDPQEHKARWHQPRTGPKSRSWIFKPHTRPNSTPIKVNKSLPLITALAGSGPYWCLLEARYKVWLLLYCYTSDPYSLHYLRACKQARNSDHTVIQTPFASLIGMMRAQRRVWICITQSSSAQNLQDAVKQSGSIKKLKWNSLEKGIIKCLTSITPLYLF